MKHLLKGLRPWVLVAGSLSMVSSFVACAGGDDMQPIPHETQDSGAGDSAKFPDGFMDITLPKEGSPNPDGAPDGTLPDEAATDSGGDGHTGEGGSDGGLSKTSAQIQAVRNAADATAADGGIDGGGPISLPIQNALVTYTKALIGGDVGGFFVQADPLGPAVFIAVDTTTLTPSPVVGDKVSFTVVTVTKDGGVREATAITGFTRVSQANSLASFVQDVSGATDLVTALDSYESELVKVSGTLMGAFSGSGTGFVAAEFSTTGIPSSTSLKLRVPTTVQTALDLEEGCVLGVASTPMWRFYSQAQPSAWVTADLTVTSCPAPQVVSAVATTSTSVTVTFDRQIAPASLVATGSQFVFNNGLTATAAAVTGKQATVTTSTQAGGSYTVTVAATLTDLLGSGVSATADTATFSGFAPVATVQINEVNPNLSGSTDLVELYVLTAGTLGGLTLQQSLSTPLVLATLPSVSVAAGDIVVVHMNPAAGLVNETVSKGDCTDATCYPGAWDIAGGTTGITFSNQVLVVLDPTAAIQDAVAFIKTTGTPPAAFVTNLQMIQSLGDWLPADCGGVLCTCTSTPTAQAVSVDWTSVATGPTGISVARTANGNTKQATDWAASAESFGAPNP
jgi:hypothetical protein